MDPSALSQFRWLGSIGLAGSALLLAADVILVHSPIAAKDFNVFTAAVGKSDRRLVLGALLGVFAIPLVLAGFGHIYLALRPAGFWLSVPPVVLGVFAYVVGAGFHAAVPLYMAAIQEGNAADASASPLVTRMSKVFVPLQKSLALLVVSSGAWLLVSILSGRTLYPMWMAAMSPVVSVILFRLAMRISPPAVVGVLFPAGNNLSMMLFIIGSLAVVGA